MTISALRREAGEKHSSFMTQKWKDKKYRSKQSEVRKKAWTPERRKAHARRIRELWQDPNYAKKASAGFRRPKSEEHKAKIGSALRGRERPDISARQFGRKHSKETRAKISRVNSDGRMKFSGTVIKKRNHAISKAWTKAMRKRHSDILTTLTLAEIERRIRKANRHLEVLKAKGHGICTILKVQCSSCGTKWKESWEQMYSHLGKCPTCHPHRFGASEREVQKIIQRVTGWKFPKVRPDWLKGRNSHPMELDGYNEQHKVAFEYQGEQHYTPIFGEKAFEVTRRNDERKRVLCYLRKVILIRIPYWKQDVEGFIRTKLCKAGFMH